MKKLIICFFASFFILIFIWTIVGYFKHGTDLLDMHLDLKHSFENLTRFSKWDISFAENWLDELYDSLQFDGDFFENILDFINILISPIKLIFDFFIMILDVVSAIFEFIFDPKFI